MGRAMLPRALKKCEREGCENVFVVKLGSKYGKRFCSSRCAALANANKPRKRRKKSSRVKPVIVTYKNESFTLKDLQDLPVNFASGSGGKFAEVCNAILSGKYCFVGF